MSSPSKHTFEFPSHPTDDRDVETIVDEVGFSVGDEYLSPVSICLIRHGISLQDRYGTRLRFVEVLELEVTGCGPIRLSVVLPIIES
jgi:hypothetical protein